MSAHCAKIDQFAEYCKSMRHIYGKDVPLMTRERWDAACSEPRKTRVLTESEFDYEQESMRNGDGPIY
jgi:hypothetical protein